MSMKGAVGEYFQFLRNHPVWWVSAIVVTIALVVGIVLLVGPASNIPMLYQLN